MSTIQTEVRTERRQTVTLRILLDAETGKFRLWCEFLRLTGLEGDLVNGRRAHCRAKYNNSPITRGVC